VAVGWGKQEEEGQTGGPVQQGMYLVTEDSPLSGEIGPGSVGVLVRLGGQQGGIQAYIPAPGDARLHCSQYQQAKRATRGALPRPLSLLERVPVAGTWPWGKPQAWAKAGHSLSQSRTS